ncbi:hypothetical protein RM553_11420 [Zunongwangia sp. F363]|uniref:Uncharacterized protein n=1 Tax=Autumnicola tepida TaxID=3075595 RepID=A0ABU3CAT4_9FLAO|nr:hypothetical protein [Zunongwangia sp. F363]MDT0643441.1 hypothetical protein [Zunongwangia sp. F363]
MKRLFSSQYFTSYQCDKGRCFYVDFNHKIVKLSFCQLLAFRQQVKNINPESHFNGKNKHGLEILMLCNREHLFILNTMEVLDLQELVHGTFGMLELNSILSTGI